MYERLKKIVDKGYNPDTILDLGAHKGIWTEVMKKYGFGDCDFHLFEAIDYEELKRFASDPKTNVYNVLLSDKIEDVDWYEMKNTGDSMFRENTQTFNNCNIIKKSTIDLDTYVINNDILNESNEIFIKIDCQGAEIPILKGCPKILKKTNFIVMEIPLFGQWNKGVPNFLEHIKFMDDIGFIPYEVVENHYSREYNIQIDMLFISKNHPFNIDVERRGQN